MGVLVLVLYPTKERPRNLQGSSYTNRANFSSAVWLFGNKTLRFNVKLVLKVDRRMVGVGYVFVLPLFDSFPPGTLSQDRDLGPIFWGPLQLIEMAAERLFYESPPTQICSMK